MHKLLVLYTGGTIGMRTTAAGLAPVAGLLPPLMKRLHRQERHIDIVEYPVLIDSSTITLAHWQSLVSDIARHYDRYDGFVVIHGTDTMAYTGSMLAFALPGLGKPIVLTGSQLPLEHPHSDGWNNLMDALDAACQPELTEVVIVFGRRLIRACRARKLHTTNFRGFGSPNARLLGKFGVQPQWYRKRWLKTAVAFAPVPLRNVAVGSFFLSPGVSSRLIGQALEQADLQGAVLMSYGSGHAPADPDLLYGVQAATNAGKLIVNITQVVQGTVEVGTYCASQPLAQAGAVSGLDMTPEAAVTKLTVLLSQNLTNAERRAQVVRSLAGELTLANIQH